MHMPVCAISFKWHNAALNRVENEPFEVANECIKHIKDGGLKVTIKVGDKMPDGGFAVMTGEGPGGVTTSELFGGKKVVLFAVPGAFTPTCSAKHLPGFVENAAAIKAKGVDTVACLSVNDVFVMDAWGKSAGADGNVTMLADGNCDYCKALGLELDATGFGMGMRGARFALVVDDGVVTQAYIESAPTELVVSAAENVLKNL